jgi:hypothetical protein
LPPYYIRDQCRAWKTFLEFQLIMQVGEGQYFESATFTLPFGIQLFVWDGGPLGRHLEFFETLNSWSGSPDGFCKGGTLVY